MLICGAFLLGIAVRVHPMAGDLRHPSLSLPADTPNELRAKLMLILADDEAQFLGGRFINASTTLEYGGATPALNRMVAKLIDCQGVKVRLHFTNTPNGPAWSVEHNAWAEPLALGLGINLGAPSIRAEDLKLPALSKPAATARRVAR